MNSGGGTRLFLHATSLLLFKTLFKTLLKTFEQVCHEGGAPRQKGSITGSSPAIRHIILVSLPIVAKELLVFCFIPANPVLRAMFTL